MKKIAIGIIILVIAALASIALVACVPAEQEQDEKPMTEAEIIEKMKSDVTNSVNALEKDVFAKPEAQASEKLALALPNEDELDGYLDEEGHALVHVATEAVGRYFEPIKLAVEQLEVGDLAYRHKIDYTLEYDYGRYDIIDFLGIYDGRVIVALEWYSIEGETRRGETVTRDSADKMYFSFYWNTAEDYEVESIYDIEYKVDGLTRKSWIVFSYNSANNSTYFIEVYSDYNYNDYDYDYNYSYGYAKDEDNYIHSERKVQPTAFTELVDKTVEEVMANYRKPVGENGEVLYNLDEPKPMSGKTITITR